MEEILPNMGMKRALDIVVALLGLLLLSIPMILIALFIKIAMGSPIFFCQTRSGHKGKLFTLYKFRTMRLSKEMTLPASDRDRVTRLGRYLRAGSFDELPELFNVLKGDMSLVGPRPLLPQYLDRYSPEQSRRHEVKPGLTGWAQVNGRNAITWEEKFVYDVWYVDNHSLWLDLKIIAMTLVKVFSGEGISAPGEATMPEFMGTPSPGSKENNA